MTLRKKIGRNHLMAPHISPIDYALTMLMSRSKIPWKCKLEPEQKECVDFADILRMATLNNKLKAVWCHVPNEGKRHPFVAIILKAMGMLPGALDYWFIWETGGGLIEFKIGKNKPTDHQQYFMTWCDVHKVPKAVCYSKEAGVEVLKSWGVLV